MTKQLDWYAFKAYYFLLLLCHISAKDLSMAVDVTPCTTPVSADPASFNVCPPQSGAHVWFGEDLASHNDWTNHLTHDEAEELLSALTRVREKTGALEQM